MMNDNRRNETKKPPAKIHVTNKPNEGQRQHIWIFKHAIRSVGCRGNPKRKECARGAQMQNSNMYNRKKWVKMVGNQKPRIGRTGSGVESFKHI